MTAERQLVVLALALILLAGAVAVGFAWGAHTPPDIIEVEVVPPPTTFPTTTELIPPEGAVRGRINGFCTTTGEAEAKRLKMESDESCSKVGP